MQLVSTRSDDFLHDVRRKCPDSDGRATRSLGREQRQLGLLSAQERLLRVVGARNLEHEQLVTKE